MIINYIQIFLIKLAPGVTPVLSVCLSFGLCLLAALAPMGLHPTSIPQNKETCSPDLETGCKPVLFIYVTTASNLVFHRHFIIVNTSKEKVLTAVAILIVFTVVARNPNSEYRTPSQYQTF